MILGVQNMSSLHTIFPTALRNNQEYISKNLDIFSLLSWVIKSMGTNFNEYGSSRAALLNISWTVKCSGTSIRHHAFFEQFFYTSLGLCTYQAQLFGSYTDPEQISACINFLQEPFHIIMRSYTDQEQIPILGFSFNGLGQCFAFHLKQFCDGGFQKTHHYLSIFCTLQQTLIHTSESTGRKQAFLVPKNLLKFCISIFNAKFQDKTFCSACLFKQFHQLNLHYQDLSY